MPGALPVRLGILSDFPQPDSDSTLERGLRLGIDEVAAAGRLDRDVEFVAAQGNGLPFGSEHEVVTAFQDLERAGCLAVVGPAISDNGLITAPLADAAGLPCINYTGGDLTRGHYGFHYQIGSLEEEPVVLAQRLDARGLRRPAVVFDRSPVGRRYSECFEAAASTLGLEIVGTVGLAPGTEDATGAVRRARDGDPDALVYLGLGVSSRAVALALTEAGWSPPVLANSALMFGYAQPAWRDGWAGWEYVDIIADDNERRRRLTAEVAALGFGPIGCAAVDMGRLLAEGIVRADHLTRAGVRDGLERVKRLPATCGHEGTMLTFGYQDHGALHGDYLVLRTWAGGETVQVDR